MAKHVKRSVIPIYLVGVVWLVFGLGLRLYQPVDYILCALVSVAAFVVGKAIFPDKSYQIAGGEDEEEKKQAEQEEMDNEGSRLSVLIVQRRPTVGLHDHRSS